MIDERLNNYKSFFEKGLQTQGLSKALEHCKKTYDFGEQTPFDAILFPDSKFKLVIQGERLASVIEDTSLLSEINYIKKCINDQKKIGGRVSLPFILTGKFGEKGIIIFNKIFIDKESFYQRSTNGSIEDENPNFDSLIQNFTAFADNPEGENRVVIIGYTNPRDGSNDTNCFVFEDLEVAVGFNLAYSSKKVKVLLMNVNSIGDFNVIGYEDGVYLKYPDVYVDDNGKLVKLPSWTKNGYLNLKKDADIVNQNNQETGDDGLDVES